MATGHSTPETGPSGSIEALKRLKTAESEWEVKVSEARGRVEEEIQKLRADVEASIREAKSEVEAYREKLLTESRAKARAEAEEIVRAGEREAKTLAGGAQVSLPSDLKGRIVRAGLGSFAPSPE